MTRNDLTIDNVVYTDENDNVVFTDTAKFAWNWALFALVIVYFTAGIKQLFINYNL